MTDSNEPLGQQSFYYPQIRIQPSHDGYQFLTKIYDPDQMTDKRFKIQNKSSISAKEFPASGADEYDDVDAEEDANMILDNNNNMDSKYYQANLLKETGMLEGFSTEKQPLSPSEEIKDEALHEKRTIISTPSMEDEAKLSINSQDIHTNLLRSHIREPSGVDDETLSKEGDSVIDSSDESSNKHEVNDNQGLRPNEPAISSVQNEDANSDDASSKRESIENMAEDEDQMIKDLENADNDEDDFADDSDLESSDNDRNVDQDSDTSQDNEDQDDDDDDSNENKNSGDQNEAEELGGEEEDSIDAPDSDDLFDNGVSIDVPGTARFNIERALNDEAENSDETDDDDDDAENEDISNDIENDAGDADENEQNSESDDALTDVDSDDDSENDIDTGDILAEDEPQSRLSDTCDEGERRSAIFEYVSALPSTEDANADSGEPQVDELNSVKRNNFECAECMAAASKVSSEPDKSNLPMFGFSNKESEPSGLMDKPDIAYCQNPTAQSSQDSMVSPSGYMGKRSEGLNSVFAKYAFTPTTCPAHCNRESKRSETSEPLSMEFHWLWNTLNSALKYHTAGRSSIAILVDGNIQASKAVIRRFALNLMLLFSRDSGVILGHFTACLGRIQMDEHPMVKSWSDSKESFERLLRSDRVALLGSPGDRKVAWSISSVIDAVATVGEMLRTKMKIIFLIVNGPVPASDFERNELQKLGELIKQREIQVYIIQIGGNFSSCLWSYLTPPQRIFSVHESQQLLYGGQLESTSISNTASSLEQTSLASGLILLIQNRMRAWTKQIAEDLKAQVIEKDGVVGWSTEISVNPASSAEPTTSSAKPTVDLEDISRKRGEITIPDYFSPEDSDGDEENDQDVTLEGNQDIEDDDQPSNGEEDSEKRQNIRRLSRRTGRVMRRLQRGRGASRRFGRLVASGGRRINRIRHRVSNRLNRITNRIHNVAGAINPSIPLNSNFMNSLSNMWNWGNVFPGLQSGVINPVDYVFLVDTVDPSTSPVIQKLVYNIIKLFPSSLSRGTLLALRSARVAPIYESRAFSTDQDIMRAVSTIPSSRGKAFTISPHLTNLLAPTSRYFTTQNRDVVILLLRRPISDFASFRYLGGLYRARRIAVYVIGPGMIAQQPSLLELTSPDRLFLTPTLDTFLTRPIMDRLADQIRRDFGSSQPVLDITGTRLSRPFRFNLPESVSRSRRPLRTRGHPLVRARPSIWSRNRLTRVGQRAQLARSSRLGMNRFAIGKKRSDINERQIIPRIRRRIRRFGRRRRITGRTTNRLVRARQSAISRILPNPVVPTPTIPTLPDGTPPIQLPISVVSPGTISILIDGSFHRNMNRIRNLVRGILNSFVREGTYITISFFGTRIHRVANNEMCLNAPQVDQLVNRIHGIRGGRRLTGQALYDAIRSSGGSVPGSASSLIVILAGASQDDYLAPSIELRKSGIRVITLTGSTDVSNNEANSISSTPQLSFRFSPQSVTSAINRLIPVFQSIYGIRSGPTTEPGRFIVAPDLLARLWNWKSFRSGVLYRSVAPTQIAVLMDMTENPDMVIRMCHNVLRLFSRRSPISMRTIGLSGDARVNGVEFRLYEDPSALQLQLQGLTGNAFVSRIARSRYALGRRRVTMRSRTIRRRRLRSSSSLRSRASSSLRSRAISRSRASSIRSSSSRRRRIRRVHSRTNIPTYDDIVDDNDDDDDDQPDKRYIVRRLSRYSNSRMTALPNELTTSTSYRYPSTSSSSYSKVKNIGTGAFSSASSDSLLNSDSADLTSTDSRKNRFRMRNLLSSKNHGILNSFSSYLNPSSIASHTAAYNTQFSAPHLSSSATFATSPRYSKYKRLQRRKQLYGLSKTNRFPSQTTGKSGYVSRHFYNEEQSKEKSGGGSSEFSDGDSQSEDRGVDMGSYAGSLAGSDLAESASQAAQVDQNGLVGEQGISSLGGHRSRSRSSGRVRGASTSVSGSFSGSGSVPSSTSSSRRRPSALAASSTGGMSVVPSTLSASSYTAGRLVTAPVGAGVAQAEAAAAAATYGSSFGALGRSASDLRMRSSSSLRRHRSGSYFGRRYRGMRNFVRYYGFGRANSNMTTRRWIRRYGHRLMSRTWTNLAYRMNQVANHMRSRSYVSISGGPNRNQALIMILSGWPYRRRGTTGDGGFWRAARRLRAAGIRLYITVMQSRRTRNSEAQPILRAASTAYLWRNWRQAQRAVSLMRATFSRHLGLSTHDRYPVVYQRDPTFSTSGYNLMPRLRPSLPASTETFLNTNYLTSIQTLSRTHRWKRIIPGIRYHYIRCNVNVVFLVDISKHDNFFAIRDLVKNLMRLFSYRYTRFTLVTISNRIHNRFINARFGNHTQLSRAINRIGAVGPRVLNPAASVRSNYGQGLRYISTRILPRLVWRAKTLVILIATRASGDNILVGSTALQHRGVSISTIGVGNQYNSDELSRAASNPQLHASGYECMLPTIVYRLEYAYSLLCHGVRNVRRVSTKSATIFQPSSTVFVSRRSLGRPSRISLASRHRLTSRRTDIPSEDNVKVSSISDSTAKAQPIHNDAIASTAAFSASSSKKNDDTIKKSEIVQASKAHSAKI